MIYTDGTNFATEDKYRSQEVQDRASPENTNRELMMIDGKKNCCEKKKKTRMTNLKNLNRET